MKRRDALLLHKLVSRCSGLKQFVTADFNKKCRHWKRVPPLLSPPVFNSRYSFGASYWGWGNRARAGVG